MKSIIRLFLLIGFASFIHLEFSYAQYYGLTLNKYAVDESGCRFSFADKFEEKCKEARDRGCRRSENQVFGGCLAGFCNRDDGSDRDRHYQGCKAIHDSSSNSCDIQKANAVNDCMQSLYAAGKVERPEPEVAVAPELPAQGAWQPYLGPYGENSVASENGCANGQLRSSYNESLYNCMCDGDRAICEPKNMDERAGILAEGGAADLQEGLGLPGSQTSSMPGAEDGSDNPALGEAEIPTSGAPPPPSQKTPSGPRLAALDTDVVGTCPTGCRQTTLADGRPGCSTPDGRSIRYEQATPAECAPEPSDDLLAGSVVGAKLEDANYSALNGDYRQRYNDVCESKKDIAETCCGDSPASCISDSFGTNEGSSSMGAQALNILAQGSMIMSNSIGQLCGRMKTVAQGATAINVALGATCTQKVGVCKKSCGDLLKELQTEKSKLLEEAETEGITLTDQNFEGINTIMAQTNNAINKCKTADNGTVRAAMSAYASYQAAKMADVCKTQAGNGNELQNLSANSFDVDCSAGGAAANPICQAQCQRPGAENDPICQSILQNLNGNTTAATFGATGEGGADDDSFDTGDILEDDQELNVGDIDGGSSGLSSVAGGGGGGLGPGGGGSFGGAGGVGAPGAPRNRGPRSILKGTNSGNGYTRSALRTGARGGYRGPASNKGAAPGAYKKGKKFSLKDFLPGGKANPKRGLAGFSKGNSEIGSKTSDLFNRISARFYEICLKNRLYDCRTITNRKRGR